jgi:hypothetical protein
LCADRIAALRRGRTSVRPERAPDVLAIRQVPGAGDGRLAKLAVARQDTNQEIERPQREWKLLEDERLEPSAFEQLEAADDSFGVDGDEIASEPLTAERPARPLAQ